MRIVTYQGIDFVSELIRNNDYITANTKLVDEDLTENGEYFRKAYVWMCAQMHHRVGHPPKDVKYPIWGWRIYDGLDMDTEEGVLASAYNARLKDGFPVLFQIILDIPDNRVLLSDEALWHMPLNGWPIMPMCSQRGENALTTMLKDASPKVCDQFTEESWKWIFELGRGSTYMSGETPGEYIQATFWEIKPGDIVKITPIQRDLDPDEESGV